MGNLFQPMGLIRFQGLFSGPNPGWLEPKTGPKEQTKTRAFSVVAPHLWNKRMPEIHLPTSLGVVSKTPGWNGSYDPPQFLAGAPQSVQSSSGTQR